MNSPCRTPLTATLLTTILLPACGASDVERLHPKPVVFNAITRDDREGNELLTTWMTDPTDSS